MKQCSASCLVLAVAVGSLHAQGLQLPTAVVGPSLNFVQSSAWGPYPLHLPVGPVVFPVTWGGFFGLPALGISRTGNTLSLSESVFVAEAPSQAARATCNLVTTASMPLPARLAIEIAHSVVLGSAHSFAVSAVVDIGADSSLEFTSSYPTSPVAPRVALVDSHGTPIRWAEDAFASWGILSQFPTYICRLDLRFTAPVQEPAYGPVCAGELGCQLVPNASFARVLVASLPTDTTYAWLLGGDQQQNLQFPGFACPLLVDPLVVIAVPLVDGANGRKFVDFDAVFPPLPGQVWFAQCIATSGGTFVGTNGVRIQT